MTLGCPRVLLLDVPTNGLDTVTVMDILSALAVGARVFRLNVIVTLMQPPPEAFHFFSTVTLLSEGRAIYHGPSTTAEAHFASLGFHRPPHVEIGDYLIDLCSSARRGSYLLRPGGSGVVMPPPDGHASGAAGPAALSSHPSAPSTRPSFAGPGPLSVAAGGGAASASGPHSDGNFVVDVAGMRRTGFTTEALAAAQRASPNHAAAVSVMEHRPAPPDPRSVSGVLATLSYMLTPLRELQLIVGRQAAVYKRFAPFMYMRIFTAAFLGLVMGTLFFNMPTTNAYAYTRIALIFMVVLFMAFGAFGNIPPWVAERVVLTKQRSAHFFRVPTYLIGTTILLIPVAFVEALIMCTLIYWMTNINALFTRYLLILLLLFLVSFLMSALFRTIAAISPTVVVSQALAASFTLVAVVFTGFTVPVSLMPAWVRWIAWVNPLSWAFEATSLAVLSGATFTCTNDELWWMLETLTPTPHVGTPLPPSAPVPQTAPSPASYPSGAPFILSNGTGVVPVCPITTGEQVLIQLGLHTNIYFFWVDVAVLLGWFVVCFLAAWLSYQCLVFRNVPPSRVRETTYDAAIAPLEPQTAIPLFFRSVSYSVPIGGGASKTLLDGVDAVVLPGRLTALMGESGAGKTTLLDVLACRKHQGTPGGDLYFGPVDMHDAIARKRSGAKALSLFRKSSAYVEQFDSLCSTETVIEAIEFSAALRYPRARGAAARRRHVRDVLQLLDLVPVASHVIGEAGDGLSPEQKKRVSIALELAADPPVVFLDEPTTGLDPQGARLVIACLRRIVDSGRTVLATIHQPSLAIFRDFDDLVLLQRGGFVAYAGPIHAYAPGMPHPPHSGISSLAPPPPLTVAAPAPGLLQPRLPPPPMYGPLRGRGAAAGGGTGVFDSVGVVASVRVGTSPLSADPHAGFDPCMLSPVGVTSIGSSTHHHPVSGVYPPVCSDSSSAPPQFTGARHRGPVQGGVYGAVNACDGAAPDAAGGGGPPGAGGAAGCGRDCAALRAHFHSFPDVRRCGSQENPGSWVLDVLNASGVDDGHGHHGAPLHARWKGSAAMLATKASISLLLRMYGHIEHDGNDDPTMRNAFGLDADDSRDVPARSPPVGGRRGHAHPRAAPPPQPAHVPMPDIRSGVPPGAAGAVPVPGGVAFLGPSGKVATAAELGGSRGTAGALLQLLLCTRRVWRHEFRSPGYNLVRLFTALLIGLLYGFTWWNMGWTSEWINARFGLIFLIMTFYVALPANMTIPFWFAHKPIFFREGWGSLTYRPSIYGIAILLVEIPFIFLMATLAAVVIWFPSRMGNTAGTFFIFWLFVLITVGFSTIFALLVTFASASQTDANASFGLVMPLATIFSGFIITRPLIPHIWVWLYWINPFRYLLEGFIVGMLQGAPIACPSGYIKCSFQSDDQTIRSLGMYPQMLWPDAGIVLALCFIGGAGVIALMATKRPPS